MRAVCSTALAGLIVTVMCVMVFVNYIFIGFASYTRMNLLYCEYGILLLYFFKTIFVCSVDDGKTTTDNRKH